MMEIVFAIDSYSTERYAWYVINATIDRDVRMDMYDKDVTLESLEVLINTIGNKLDEET